MDEAPADKVGKGDWQTRRRKLLAKLVSAKEYDVDAEEVKVTGATEKLEERPNASATTIRRWRLRLSNTWTVPAVELSRGESKSTTIIAADTGRAALAERWERAAREYLLQLRKMQDQTSMLMVTGPSLVRLTAMSAPNWPT